MNQHTQESLDAARVALLFQALIRNAFDVIKVVDPQAKTVFVSPSVERVLGYQPRELIGTNPLDFVHPDDLERATQALESVRQSGSVETTGPIRARHKDGSWRTMEAVLQNLVDDVDVRGIVMNYRDISERHESENQLRLLEERFEKAFRNSPDSITITDIETGRIIEVNDGFERITGYRRSDIVGRTTLELGIWKDLEVRKHLADVVRRDGRVRDMFIEFVARGGAVLSCLVSAEVIHLDGRPCFLAVTRDITDRVIADEKLRQTTEKLQQEHQEVLRKNIAFQEVVDHIDEEKAKYRHEICTNIDNLLRPTMRKLQQDGRLSRRDIDVLVHGLDEITGKHINDYRNNVSKLTPREMDILDMIKTGRSSKQIAEALGLSSQTVHKHRQSIRRKLQLDHREINLAAYLRSH
ncbi:MAG TPA: PAS domain S-box protein [Candidatus Krumholzibacteria bacterium]|nr:PAS domain S-box protein [Candidatus Krumholzibacteria bacterium]